MTAFVLLIVGLLVGFGGGWYCKGRFGAKAALVEQGIQAAAKNIVT